MKRHPALRTLSSEHHSGLVLARKAHQAAEGSADERESAWAELSTRFHVELEPHFQREETGLLPALRASGATPLVERTLDEHASVRRLIAADTSDNLAQVADLLNAHIRFEERELFERAQQLLSPEQLAELLVDDPQSA